MTMSGADRVNYQNQMQAFECRMDRMIELLEALLKQGEEITKLSEKVSEIYHRLNRLEQRSIR